MTDFAESPELRADLDPLLTSLQPTEDPDIEAGTSIGVDSVEDALLTPELEDRNRLQRAFGVGKRAVQATALAIEVSPFTNGPIRYGAFAATLAETGSTLQSAAVLAGSTMLVEGAGALAVSDVLDRGTSKTVSMINKLLDKFIPREAKVTPVAEAVIANYLGTPAVLVAKQRENPERTREQNRKHGITITAALAGACAIQGAAIAEGIADPTNPKVILPAVAVLGGMQWGFRKAKNKIKGEK